MNDFHLFKAAREASRAADYSGYNAVKIGCVVVYKGTILAKGCNSDRTHPLQARYNMHRYKDVGNRYLPPKGHAEIRVITKIRYLDIDFSKVHIYIYREYKNGEPAPARPCPACMAYIKSLGIKHIHYTTDLGTAHEVIKEEI